MQILPSGLKSLAIRSAAATKVYIGICPIFSTISTCSNLRTQPRNRHTLGNINPDTKCCRSTINSEIVAQTKAGTISTAKVRPVIFQFKRFMTKADNIGKFCVGIGYHGTLDHPAASGIMIHSNSIGCSTGKALHGSTDGRIIPRVRIAPIDNHDRSHADIQCNRGRQVTTCNRNNRATGIFNIIGYGEEIACKCTCSFIGNAPYNITVLQIDGFVLIGSLKSQITDLLVVESQFSRSKRQIVRILYMNHGRTDNFSATDHIYRHISGFSGRCEYSGSFFAIDRCYRKAAHRFIIQCECRIFWQGISRSTGIIHCSCRKFDDRVGCIIFSVRCNGGMVKLTGSRHSGNYENRTGNNTLAATGRRIAHSQITLTFALRNISGRAAFVQLNSRNTSESDHHMSLFFCGITNRTRCHSTVCLEKNDCTVCLDTNAGARIISSVTGLTDNDLTVPDHSDQSVYSLDNFYSFSLLCALICFSLRQSCTLSEHIYRAVIKSCKKRTCRAVMMYNAVHYQIA